MKYLDRMKEFQVTLDSEALDPAFVSKVKDFETKVKNNELSDEEIEAGDNELLALFNEHDLSEDDSEEVKEANRIAAIATGKADVAEAGTHEELENLRGKYKEYPDVIVVLDKKVAAINKKAGEEQTAKLEKFMKDAKAEIKAAKFEDLQAMGEKYKDYPELVTIIKKRHVDEKPNEDNKQLAAKLLLKSEWSYAELKAMGIEPTGNDMTVEGVRLEKEYLLSIYSVRK